MKRDFTVSCMHADLDQKERDLVMRSSVAIWSDHELSPSILEAIGSLSHLIASYHISRKFQAVAAECATGIHRACGSKARASNPEALQENNVQAEQYSECLCVQVPHSYRCIGCDSRHVFAESQAGRLSRPL